MADENKTEEQISGVDAGAINAAQRRNTLESKLAKRPDIQDLKDKNILHGDPTHQSALIQQKGEDLKREMTKDSLDKALQTRSDRKDLENRHILYPEGEEPSHHEAEKKALADGLAHRSDASALVDKGILTADEAPTA